LDLNIFDRKNNALHGNSDNFVKSFINELKDYLDKNVFKNLQNNRNLTYAVASEPNDKGEVFVTVRNGTGAGKDFKLSELPNGSQFGTILRWKNGKFVMDEKLSQESISSWERVRRETKELVSQYKMEGVDYLITEKNREDVTLINQTTGLEFVSNDFWQEDFEKLEIGMTLTCKDGEYIIKDQP